MRSSYKHKPEETITVSCDLDDFQAQYVKLSAELGNISLLSMRFSLSTTKMLVNPYVSIYRNNKLRRALNIISITGIKRFQNLSKEITHSIQNSDSCFLYITSDSFTSSQGSNLQLITYSNSFVLNPAKKNIYIFSSFYIFYQVSQLSISSFLNPQNGGLSCTISIAQHLALNIVVLLHR